MIKNPDIVELKNALSGLKTSSHLNIIIKQLEGVQKELRALVELKLREQAGRHKPIDPVQNISALRKEIYFDFKKG